MFIKATITAILFILSIKKHKGYSAIIIGLATVLGILVEKEIISKI
jgi:hypothetical protein